MKLQLKITSRPDRAAWLECYPVHQNVVGLISQSGHIFGFDPQSGYIQKARVRIKNKNKSNIYEKKI